MDLIYLDPPFNSKTDYNVLYAANGAGDAQYRAFSDTWTWDSDAADRLDRYGSAIGRRAHDAIMGLYRMFGPSGMLAYLTYMAERLEECHRLLKPTGSIYLHCDPTASHGLKLVMDGIFGVKNFRNEVHWYYYNKMHDRRKKLFAAASDTLLFYVKDIASRFTFHQLTEPREKPVRQLLRKKVGGKMVNARDEAGKLMYQTKTTRTIDNVWRIPCIVPAAKERLGYPTQKPLRLLERVIQASSDPDDLVLDPFCGCGTAIDAANRLGRRWAGIDISSFAIDLIRGKRLKDRTIPVKGIPYDLASAIKLAREQPFNFESWAVTRLPGFAPNTKQVADGGVDGRATLAHKPDNHPSRLALAQVKGGKFSLSALRDFIHVTDRDRAALGYFVTLEAVRSRAAKEAVANTGRVSVSGYPYRRMQLWPISDYFDERLPAMPIMADPYSGKPLEQGSLF
ncbi:MAG: DNA methyltransferase [Gammaproteobacteria bacterium]|nr:DNA methyltransferase [Gammaproteobacteria bacterium]